MQPRVRKSETRLSKAWQRQKAAKAKNRRNKQEINKNSRKTAKKRPNTSKITKNCENSFQRFLKHQKAPRPSQNHSQTFPKALENHILIEKYHFALLWPFLVTKMFPKTSPRFSQGSAKSVQNWCKIHAEKKLCFWSLFFITGFWFSFSKAIDFWIKFGRILRSRQKLPRSTKHCVGARILKVCF